MIKGGVGVGPVTDIPGREWKSYIRTMPHQDYISGSSCFCAAQFQFLRRYFNSDDFGFSFTIPKGGSVIEPGITPAMNVTLGPYATMTDYVNTCAESRLIGGVHFRAAIREGVKVCTPIGDEAYEFIMAKIAGK